MKMEIPYGKERRLRLDVPEGARCDVIYPNAVRCKDECQTLMQAVSNPLGGKPLEQFASEAGAILVVVNDATRPTPTAKMLDCIIGKLKGKRIHYISAVGSHRAPTEAEHREMFGRNYDNIKDRILVHECKNEQDMTPFGKTRLGTDIMLNKAVMEHDSILIITSVEPHYFAGYTGGRKSIFPGLAAYSSIAQNHKWALDERAATFALDGNPVHDDMEEIVEKLGKRIFAVQAVLDAHRSIYAAFAGDYRLTFKAAVKKADEVFAVKIREKADIVVTVAPYPTDIDL
jgi:nickel-dependent lactate racemase